MKDQVAGAIADRRAHQRIVADDAGLEHVIAAAELARLFFGRGHRDAAVLAVLPGQAAVCYQRTDAGRRVERRNPASAGAQAFGKRPLRAQLDLEIAVQILPLELFILTDVRTGGPADPFVVEEDAEAPPVDAAVVRHGNQIGRALLEQRLDEVVRDTV